MALTKATNSMIQGAFANVLDFGADDTGTNDSSSAIQAALDSSAHRVVIPAGTYKLLSSLTLPERKTLEGAGLLTKLVVYADIIAINTRPQTTLRDIQIDVDNSVSHTKDLVQCGVSAGASAARSIISNVFIQNAGQHGIHVINGNLGVIENCKVESCTSDGIHFSPDVGNTNVWTLQGFNDLIANGRDGLHFEKGGGGNESLTHQAIGVVAQSNGRYGVYINTRQNLIACYVENNTSGQVYLDSDAKGNEIRCLVGAASGPNATGQNNLVYHPNGLASNIRYVQSKALFSGSTGAGLRIFDNDNGAGALDLEKTAARQYKFFVGSGADESLFFSHTNASYRLNLFVDGQLAPETTQVRNLGSAALEWDNIYLVNSPVVSSDENYKHDIRDINEAERRIAIALKSKMKAFRHNHAEGDDARIHIGVIAQQVRDAFEAENLDASDYGMFCKDILEDGTEKLAIRYEQLLAFIISAL